MPYSPPFTITADIVNLLADISEQVGRLNASAISSSPQLRKRNRIKSITGTLAIEGNSLTEKQITGIIDGKRVMGTMRELAEAQGAIAAYDALPNLVPDKVEELLKVHSLMMADVLVNAGQFRKKGVGVLKGSRVQHIAPQAHRVPGLIRNLFQWLQKAKDHPLITSSVFHYEFEFIHPFSDGNGRMGRLWQTLILSKWHPLFLSLPLESVVRDNQQGYYQALEESGKQGASTAFVRFMLKVILQTIRQNVTVNTPVNAPVNTIDVAALKTPEAIMALLQNNPAMTRQQLAEHIGKNIRTIARALAKLQQAGKIKRVGSDKTGHWQSHGETTDEQG